MYDYTIDAGHGGIDPGAVGPTGLKEKDINLKLALKVGKLITDRGAKISYTRIDDITLSLTQRATIANNVKARNFVSFHVNASTNINATGFEIWTSRGQTGGDKLADKIGEQLQLDFKNISFRTDFSDGDLDKESNFTVLVKTEMPAALIEILFINNPKEEAMLRDENFLDKVAEGIAKGMLEFIGLKWETGTTVKNEIYRVRKVWTDVNSQVGAYKDIENAKIECDKIQGYSVFDNSGNKVYPLDLIENPNVKNENEIPNWQLQGYERLIDLNIIGDQKYWESRLDENITIGELFGLLAKTIK